MLAAGLGHSQLLSLHITERHPMSHRATFLALAIAAAFMAAPVQAAKPAPDHPAVQRALAHLKGNEVKVDGEAPGFLESKHSLRTRYPDLYYLDLSEAQAIALNSWSYFGGPMPDVLTPEQKALRPKLRERLQAGEAPGLMPERSGPGLAAYRKALLSWLEG